jgi:hypothetical protein
MRTMWNHTLMAYITKCSSSTTFFRMTSHIITPCCSLNYVFTIRTDSHFFSSNHFHHGLISLIIICFPLLKLFACYIFMRFFKTMRTELKWANFTLIITHLQVVLVIFSNKPKITLWALDQGLTRNLLILSHFRKHKFFIFLSQIFS